MIGKEESEKRKAGGGNERQVDEGKIINEQRSAMSFFEFSIILILVLLRSPAPSNTFFGILDMVVLPSPSWP